MNEKDQLPKLGGNEIVIIVLILIILTFIFCYKLAYRHQNSVLDQRLPSANTQLLRGMQTIEQQYTEATLLKNTIDEKLKQS